MIVILTNSFLQQQPHSRHSGGVLPGQHDPHPDGSLQPVSHRSAYLGWWRRCWGIGPPAATWWPTGRRQRKPWRATASGSWRGGGSHLEKGIMIMMMKLACGTNFFFSFFFYLLSIPFLVSLGFRLHLFLTH